MVDKDRCEEDVTFCLDGVAVTAHAGETIWQAAKRLGVLIPHLCYRDAPDYRADGNCRACMVAVKGERLPVASCIRKPAQGMEVDVSSRQMRQLRRSVLNLLRTDQPAAAHDPESQFWQWIKDTDSQAEVAAAGDGVDAAGLPPRAVQPATDSSHTAITVNLDACIHCNLCVRACREIQGNDVIGMAYRGAETKIVFDFDNPMGDSTCVACGECVQVCPTGALLPSSVVGLPPRPVSTVDTLCPFCGVGCQLQATVNNNRIERIDGRHGPANRSRLCVKGRFGYDYTHSAERLVKPLIRLPDAAKNPDGNSRDQFREASWEEALSVAASGFDKLMAEGKKLAGFGSAKGSNEEAYLFQKLIRTVFRTNNVDHCTRLCHASSVAALLEGIGSGAVTAPCREAGNAGVILVIGARPTDNHPVAATFFKNAVRKGADLIVCDPRRHGLSRFARTHLAFRAGTDVALLNAILATIIEEDLIDRNFVQTRTTGFAALAAHLEAFTPERMAEHCRIDPATIRDVARRFAKAESAIIFWGMGISQHVHGTDNARCLIALAALTGNIGKPGTGLHPLRGQNNVQGASDVGLIPMFYPDYQPVESPQIRNIFEQAWSVKLDPVKGLTVVEIMNEAGRGGISGMYIMGENPAMSDPDTRHVRAALAALEHLVVQEIFFTETAAFADVILPAATMFEKTGSFTNTNRQIQLARQALRPPGEARSDWRIIVDLAKRMGKQWHYRDESEIYTEFAGLMPSLQGISWRMLEREGSVIYPLDAASGQSQEIMFADRVPTANGLIKLVPTSLTPPAEVPDAEYPMILTTGRLLEHWHTGAMTRRATHLNAVEPMPAAHLNPREMQQRNILPGDRVRVETRRGALSLEARSDPEVAESMIFIPFCFTEQPANMLTNPALDPFGKIPEFKFCAARLASDVTPLSGT